MQSKVFMATLIGAALLISSGARAEDEPETRAKGGASFYQETVKGACSGITCTARFPQASGKKVIEASNLTCLATADGFNAPPFATFQAGPTVVSYMPLNQYVTGSSSISAGVLAGSVFIAKGQVPTVVVSGGTSLSCTLSGKLIAK